MAINIIKETDVSVTESELNRFRQEYSKAFSHYAGPVPTLEEYIRSQKSFEHKLHGHFDPW